MYNKKKPIPKYRYENEKNQPIKVEEIPREIKVPFTFSNLEVNIDPDEILQSDKPYLYFQSNPIDKFPSVMGQTDTIYDINTKQIITHNVFANYLSVDCPDEEFVRSQQKQYVYELNVRTKHRIAQIICENVMLIFDNGLGAYINNYINPVLKEKIINNNAQFMMWFDGSFSDLNIFAPRIKDPNTGFYESISAYIPNSSKYDIITNPKDPIVIMNMVDASRYAVYLVTNHYRDILDTIMSNLPMIDIDELAKDILSRHSTEKLTFENFPRASHTAICFEAINSIALDDIQKVSEIAEITTTQGVSQFYRDIEAMGLLEE